MKTPIDPLRERLYGAYASQHASCGDGEAAALIYRRDIRPALLPPAAGPVLDIGCGQGQLVKLMLADGHDAAGIDVSQELGRLESGAISLELTAVSIPQLTEEAARAATAGAAKHGVTRVTVDSTLGSGTTFTVYLPAETGADPESSR